MKKNIIRNQLPQKLDVLDLELDIKRLTAEFEYHKSRSEVFEQAIKAQQVELHQILEIQQHPEPKGDFYR